MGTDFLNLPVKTRDRVTTLYGEIKAEMKKHYTLRELGLKVYKWDDASLSEFMSLPKAHYLRMLKQKMKGRGSRNLVARVNNLYMVLEKKNGTRDRVKHSVMKTALKS